MKNKYIEIEAKTTQEAIRIALKKLRIEKKDAEIRILREEHKGLFGMEGAELAKVRVAAKRKYKPHTKNQLLG